MTGSSSFLELPVARIAELRGGTEGVDDVLEQGLEIGTDQDDDGDGGDRDQRGKQRILNHVLAVLVLREDIAKGAKPINCRRLACQHDTRHTVLLLKTRLIRSIVDECNLL